MPTAKQEESYFELIDEMKMMEKINPNRIAEEILRREKVITFKDTDEIYVYNASEGIYEPFEKELSNIIQWVCQNKTTTHTVNEILNSIRRQTYKNRKVVGEELTLIPLANGIYDFKEKKLLPFAPEKIFLKKHPLIYKPLENFEPLFQNPIEKFLTQIVEGQEDELLIKEMIGYCFYRAMPFQNMFLLYGSGGNGKGVLLHIIKAMIGEENYSAKSLQSLVEDKFAQSNLYLMNANIFGDLPSKAFKETSTLKMATGDDDLNHEKKFKDSFKFYSYAKLIASCNEVPESPDQSDAFYERPIILNFPNKFRDTKQENRFLKQELCTPDNLSHFFLTCIDAFHTALENNCLIRKETLEEKRKKYLTFSNSAAAFSENHLEYDSNSELTTVEIYERYKKYCKERNIPVKDDKVFFKTIYNLFGERIWKSRKKEFEEGLERRWSVIVGLAWQDNVEENWIIPQKIT